MRKGKVAILSLSAQHSDNHIKRENRAGEGVSFKMHR